MTHAHRRPAGTRTNPAPMQTDERFADDAADLDRELRDRIEALAYALLGKPTWRTGTELRYGRNGSLKVTIAGPHRGASTDFEADDSGGPVWLIRRVRGGTWEDAYTHAREFVGRPRCEQTTDRPKRDYHPPPRPRLTPEQALALWRSCRPIAGTLGESYLRSRGIQLPTPPSLRFAPRLHHTESGRDFPAVVAPFQDRCGRVIAVHRTFLDPGGPGKAPVTPAKKSLGSFHGGCIRLGPVAARIAVFEGIENALTLREAEPTLSVWTVGAAANLQNLDLPAEVRDVEIYIDRDEAGRRYAARAAARLQQEGRSVWIIAPPGTDGDFNDWLARRLDGIGVG